MTQIHRPWTEAEIEWLRQHYADTRTSECCKHLGRSTLAVIMQARRQRLRKREFFINNGVLIDEKVIQHRAQKRKKLIAADRLRWKNDLPQHTRLHFSNQTRGKMDWRYEMRKAGYVEFKDDKNRMYYAEGLQRHPKMESHSSRWNVEVLPLSAYKKIV